MGWGGSVMFFSCHFHSCKADCESTTPIPFPSFSLDTSHPPVLHSLPPGHQAYTVSLSSSLSLSVPFSLSVPLSTSTDSLRPPDSHSITSCLLLESEGSFHLFCSPCLSVSLLSPMSNVMKRGLSWESFFGPRHMKYA